ncbi:MAG TPA: anthranilate synthase component I family protein [bacterium]|nr:anthranilate synthase component I family protein [bacterium]
MVNIKIHSFERLVLNNIPDLLQLSFLTGRKKDRVLFYSSGLNSDLGRFSIMSLNPLFKLDSKTEFGDVLNDLFSLKEFSKIADIPIPLFSGWINYECVRYFENIAPAERNTIEVPDFQFVFSDSFIVIDNFEKKAELILLETDISKNTVEERKTQYLEELATPVPEQIFDISGVKAEALISKKEYRDAVTEIRRLIGEGSVYQVNFTYPVKVETDIPSWFLFYRYLTQNHADYAAFINSEECEVLSISPECFYHVKNGTEVSSFPIKGTIKKGDNDKKNRHLKNELKNSEKDRAELAMIVDLVRNDIGKHATCGSVKVDYHAELMEFPTLFHLVSKISGKIEKHKQIELFKSLFPGGSITGAPKISAMNIISQLEKHRRNIYTGAIGFTGLNGDTVFNIPIRTIQRSGNTLIYSTGGGITWNSDPEKEFEETLIKAKAFLNIFEDPEIVFK